MSEDDFHPPIGGFVGLDAAWGLAGLLIGCALLVSSCTLMVFNIVLFRGGLAGVPLDIARPAAVVGVIAVAGLGAAATGFGVRGWAGAVRRGESAALGVAGSMTGLVGLVAWFIAGGDLLAVLGLFA
jgi:hypothetical protein